jgi:hypothetical protein
MRYLRPLKLQPKSLRVSAQESWLRHLFSRIRNQTILSRSSGQLKRDISLDFLPELPDDDFCGTGEGSIADYLDGLVPLSFQEDLFHLGGHLLKQDEVSFDMFPVFFNCLWRSEFLHLHLPVIQDPSHRLSILERLLSSCEGDGQVVRLTSLKHRLQDVKCPQLSLEESYITKRVLRTCTQNLKCLLLWKVCDNQMLQILGTTCPTLELLDIWRSISVTDLGIHHLVGTQPAPPHADEEVEECSSNAGLLSATNAVCRSLKKVVIKETNCSHHGSILLLVHCTKLETLEFNQGHILRDFLEDVCRHHALTGQVFPLKSVFLPITGHNGYGGCGNILRAIFKALPHLEELRLWTSMSNMGLLYRDEVPVLSSLMVGGIPSQEVFSKLLVTFGQGLTKLKVETVLTTVPLEVIGRNCPHLADLQIINARVAIADHNCAAEAEETNFFAHLKLVNFFFVRYKIKAVKAAQEPISALHCILRHSVQLEGIQASGTNTLTDECLASIVQVNPLSHLKRFILTDACNSQQDIPNDRGHELQSPSAPAVNNSRPGLTSASVLLLYDVCPRLQCIGDLRHWAIPDADRRQMWKKINCSSNKWLLNTFES